MLVDADTLGDAYAAKRHKIGERTVQLWRSRYGREPKVAELCAALRERIATGWVDVARAARLRLVERQLELAEKKDARLSSVTNALRRTNELVMSHEVLNDDAGPRKAPRAEDADGAQDGDGEKGAGPRR